MNNDRTTEQCKNFGTVYGSSSHSVDNTFRPEIDNTYIPSTTCPELGPPITGTGTGYVYFDPPATKKDIQELKDMIEDLKSRFGFGTAEEEKTYLLKRMAKIMNVEFPKDPNKGTLTTSSITAFAEGPCTFYSKISTLLKNDWEPLGGIATCPDGDVMQALGKRDGSGLTRIKEEMERLLDEHDNKIYSEPTLKK